MRRLLSVAFAWVTAGVLFAVLVAMIAGSALAEAWRQACFRRAMPKREKAHLRHRDQRAWRDLSAQLRADSKRADRGTR
jgi:hypothetical protein